MCFNPPFPLDPDEGSKVNLTGFVKLNYSCHFQLNFRQKNSRWKDSYYYLVLKTYDCCSLIYPFYHQLFSQALQILYSFVIILVD